MPFQRQSRQIEGNSIWYLGKRYRFFGGKRRPLPDDAKGGAFVEDALGRWFVCFHVEAPDAEVKGNGEIGIYLGLNSFATMSDGREIENPRFHREIEEKIAVAQRARKVNRARRLHIHAANCRKDFLHKLTTELAGRNALIAVGGCQLQEACKDGDGEIRARRRLVYLPCVPQIQSARLCRGGREIHDPDVLVLRSHFRRQSER